MSCASCTFSYFFVLLDHLCFWQQVSKLGKENQERKSDSWKEGIRLRKLNLSSISRSRVFDQCMLPVLTYKAGRLTIIKKNIHKLLTPQGAMERRKLNISLKDCGTLSNYNDVPAKNKEEEEDS